MTTLAPMAAVGCRYDFVLLFDVADGNPNGDPDSGNLPRIDPQSLQGLVTDACLKRKIRNAVAVLGAGNPGMDLYFQTQDAVYERRVLNLVHQSAWDALGLTRASATKQAQDREKIGGDSPEAKGRRPKGIDRGDFDKVRNARAWMCEHFYDVRTFGAVMTTGVNCGQVRGPVQITFSRSIDPIMPLEHSITRKSVTTEREAAKQINKQDEESGNRFGTITGTMGRKNTVSYALYRCFGFINPYFAADTKFTYADLDLLWAALRGTMWEIDRSASRGLMCTRGFYVFEHASPLGNAPAHELFERIRVTPLGADAAPRNFDDYNGRVSINDASLPSGVTLHRFVG
jgi:CRISPR-associated protein Csd2